MLSVPDIGVWSTGLVQRVRGLPKVTRLAVRESAGRLMAIAREEAPVHTGSLRRSIRVAVVMRGAEGHVADVAIRTDDPAGRVQEEGAVLRQGRNPMTVPIGIERAMWDATGTRREARNVPGLFRITARDGRQYLATRSGRTLQLRFALREQVRQQAQGWASRATRRAAAGMEPEVRAVYVRELLSVGRHRP